MNTATLAELMEMVIRFRKERDWAQFHTPKELAISLCVESAELLELMQWKSGAELKRAIKVQRQHMVDELADVLHSLLLLGHDLKVDLGEALAQKLQKTAAKYPVHKAKGKPRKYTEL